MNYDYLARMHEQETRRQKIAEYFDRINEIPEAQATPLGLAMYLGCDVKDLPKLKNYEEILANCRR